MTPDQNQINAMLLLAAAEHIRQGKQKYICLALRELGTNKPKASKAMRWMIADALAPNLSLAGWLDAQNLPLPKDMQAYRAAWCVALAYQQMGLPHETHYHE